MRTPPAAGVGGTQACLSTSAERSDARGCLYLNMVPDTKPPGGSGTRTPVPWNDPPGRVALLVDCSGHEASGWRNTFAMTLSPVPSPKEAGSDLVLAPDSKPPGGAGRGHPTRCTTSPVPSLTARSAGSSAERSDARTLRGIVTTSRLPGHREAASSNSSRTPCLRAAKPNVTGSRVPLQTGVHQTVEPGIHQTVDTHACVGGSA